MLAVDSNILVYAHRRESTDHGHAFALMKSLAEDSDAWAIPWPCLYEFHSVVTNPKIWGSSASTPQQSWDQIQAWTSSPSLRLLSEVPSQIELLPRFLTLDRVRGAIVHDARIASLCLAHGVDALLTRDRDFALFPELRCVDPFIQDQH